MAESYITGNYYKAISSFNGIAQHTSYCRFDGFDMIPVSYEEYVENTRKQPEQAAEPEPHVNFAALTLDEINAIHKPYIQSRAQLREQLRERRESCTLMASPVHGAVVSHP